MNWAVVQTEAQREQAVRLLLNRIGFEVYCPRIKVRKRIKPLFPGYLFTQLGQHFYQVLWTPHVLRLLMSGDQPARLDDSIIAELRRPELGGFVRLSQVDRIRKGQSVRVIRGNFQGLTAIHNGMSSHDRVAILLEFMNQKVTVHLPISDIAAIEKFASAHRI